MNLALWVVQGLLALAYLAAGIMKVSQPVESLGKRMDWVNAVSPGVVRFIGAAEFLGALGLILPLVTGILPWLTVVAAGGLVIVQLAALVFHLQRGEAKQVPMNLVLLILALAVVYGRAVIVQA
jgi:putative oxidoreductase